MLGCALRDDRHHDVDAFGQCEPSGDVLTKSPHSPFTLVETSAGAQHLQQYMWYCPSIPSGVTTFTVTCSAPLSCSYITAWVTEWTGLTSDATVAAFDTDGGATVPIQNTTSSVSTQAATRYTKDLIFACGDNTADRLMTPGAPHLQVNQFFPGNMCMASTVTAAGSVQTATALGSGMTIGTLRSPQSGRRGRYWRRRRCSYLTGPRSNGRSGRTRMSNGSRWASSRARPTQSR